MIHPPHIQARRGFARILEPRPLQNVWQWAEANRIISKGVSAASKRAPIRYNTALCPHQREPQEAPLDPGVQTTVYVGASQTMGKTEMLNNVLGYHMDHEPTNSIVMYPTIESTERYSKRKFTPMVRDTPCLSELINPARSRDSGNTILVKEFLGGSVFFVGANSAPSLRQASGEVLIGDEIDSMGATDEGDPIELLWKRGESYESCVRILSSTPTETGSSRIWTWFEASDQRYWFAPCTKCGEHQTLKWENVHWPKSKPEAAFLTCEKCEAELTDRDRLDMYYAGEWRPTATFTGTRGYHLNGIYTPWPAHKGFRNRLHEMVAEHLRINTTEKTNPAKGRELRRVWVNTFKAECYEEEAEKPIEWQEIQNRTETYSNDSLPAGVLAITAATDVQGDRLETEIKGWGKDEESWGLGLYRFLGNPELPEVWEQQAELMAKKFTHPNGHTLTINLAVIDSGHKPKAVYAFCKRSLPFRIYPIKGSRTPEAPLRALPKKTTVRSVQLVLLGTTTAKDHIYSRLKIEKPGPRYMHFPIGLGYDEEFFQQLCAEKRRKRYVRGREVSDYVKTRARNEAIDLQGYGLGAVDILNPNWEILEKRLAKQVEVEDKKPTGDSARRTPTRRNWINEWRK